MIVLRSVSLIKAARRVLHNISLEWGSGITLLAGANGAGKTMLSRSLLGLEDFSGEISIDGKPWDRNSARRLIGYVIQDPQRHFLGLSCAEEVSLGLPSVDTHQVLLRAGLESYAEVPPLLLSGGEQRRLALAAALARQPPYLILDEPFNALDRDGVQDTLRVMLERSKKGVSILLITHDLEKCLAHVDRVILLKQGEVAAQGSVREVWSHFDAAGVHPPAAGLERLETCTWL